MSDEHDDFAPFLPRDTEPADAQAYDPLLEAPDIDAMDDEPEWGGDAPPQALPPVDAYHEQSVVLPERGVTEEITAWASQELAGTVDSIVYCRNFWGWDDDAFRYRELQESEMWRHVSALSNKTIISKVRMRDGARVPVTGPWKPSVAEVENCLRGLRMKHHDPDFFSAPVGCATATGWLTLGRGGELVVAPNGPRHRNRTSFSFAYDETADAPRWLDLLHDVWAPDDDASEKIDLLHEFIGVCLFGLAPRFEKALAFYGRGANGKSVVLEVVRHLFEDSYASVAPHDWADGRKVERLRDVTINLVSELPSDDLYNLDVFKAVISGEEVLCDPKYRDPYLFRTKTGHIFSANNLPKSNDHSDGFWRRFELVEFNRRFDTSTPKQALIDPCLEELPGIFRLCVEGAQRAVARNKLTVPPSSAAAREEWRRESQVELVWIDSCCDLGRDEWTKSKELYRSYKKYLEEFGFRSRSQTSFGAALRRAGIEKRKYKGGVEYRLALRSAIPHHDEPEDEPEEPGLF